MQSRLLGDLHVEVAFGSHGQGCGQFVHVDAGSVVHLLGVLGYGVPRGRVSVWSTRHEA